MNHEFVYLIVTGDFTEEQFRQTSKIRCGWFNPKGEREGDWVYPNNTVVIRSQDQSHDVTEALESLILQVPYLEQLPLSWQRELHVVIYTQGSQGGGFYWPAALIRKVTQIHSAVRIYHYQVHQHGHDYQGACYMPLEPIFKPSAPTAQVYFYISSGLYSLATINEKIGAEPTLG